MCVGVGGRPLFMRVTFLGSLLLRCGASSPFPASQAGAGVLQPSPSPTIAVHNLEERLKRMLDAGDAMPIENYPLFRTDMICRLPKGAQNSTSSGCGATKPQLHSHELELLIRSMPADFHLLVYGPSYMREISDALTLHAGPISAGGLKVMGEQDASDTCMCGLSAKVCDCADFGSITFDSGQRVTNVLNYGKLQRPGGLPQLRKVLEDPTRQFTHAFVMEPHQECYFTKCDGHGSCPGCPEIDAGVYGCGEWAADLWQLFSGRFLGRHQLVHIVPWTVPESMGVNRANISMRTRSIAQTWPCEAQAFDAKTGMLRAGALAVASPGTVGEGHQCLVVCQGEHNEQCRLGGPTAMAFRAMQMLTGQG